MGQFAVRQRLRIVWDTWFTHTVNISRYECLAYPMSLIISRNLFPFWHAVHSNRQTIAPNNRNLDSQEG